LLVARSAVLASDANTSPGESAVFATLNHGATFWSSEVLSASIQKGRVKSVLRVDVTFLVAHTGDCPGPYGLLLTPTVNSVALEPKSSLAFQGGGCTGGTCVLNGNFWLDIDAEEAAHPGVFVGQPLNIDVRFFAFPEVCERDGYATLSAQLVKK
jgi:hypothetical protein